MRLSCFSARGASAAGGAEGRVVGIDNASRLLGVAIWRASAHPQVRFFEGDVRTWRSEEPFDTIVGRVIFFHLPDRLEVLRHHVAALRPGGLVVALDFDLRSIRAEPTVPLVDEAVEWTNATFLSAGAARRSERGWHRCWPKPVLPTCSRSGSRSTSGSQEFWRLLLPAWTSG